MGKGTLAVFKHLIILLSIANLQCFSAEKDSLKLFSDSTLALNINTANKYKKTYQYAVPVFLIGYGFTSMDKGISRQIDKGIEHELQEKLNEAMQKLSIPHRTVITLFEIDGLSHSEIADVMDCSEGTVRSRLHYAKQFLQGELGKYLNS